MIRDSDLNWGLQWTMEIFNVFPLSGTVLSGQDALTELIGINAGSLGVQDGYSDIQASREEVGGGSSVSELDPSTLGAEAVPNQSESLALGPGIEGNPGDKLGTISASEKLSIKAGADQDPLTGAVKEDLLGGIVQINFQPNIYTDGKTVDVPSGYTPDFGLGYDDDRGYGWVRQDSLSRTHVPLNISSNARDRNRPGIDQRLDTLLHMQYLSRVNNPTAVKVPAAWEYALPSGNYNVTVSVGDSYTDSQHTINVEGVTAISRFRGSAMQEYKQATAQVNVTDGRLTIDAIKGSNTKINYVEIQAISDSKTVTVPVVGDESVYSSYNDPNDNFLTRSSVRGGLFTGVDGGISPSPARFYLKFNLPEFDPATQITAAKLTGFYNDDYDSADDRTHGIYFVASDTWSESTITWDNQPGQAYGVPEASFDAAKATVGSFIDWDITKIVNQEYQGDGVLSLLFHANAEGLVADNRNWEYFAEKEFDSAKAFRIQLTVGPVS